MKNVFDWRYRRTRALRRLNEGKQATHDTSKPELSPKNPNMEANVEQIPEKLTCYED